MRRWIIDRVLLMGIIWIAGMCQLSLAAPGSASKAAASSTVPNLPLPVAAPASTTSATVAATQTATVSASTATPVAATATTSATASAAVVANPDMVCPVLPDSSADTRFSAVYEGKTYYFCCARCVTLFTENPTKYIAAMQARVAQASSGAQAGTGEGATPTVAEVIGNVAGTGKPEAPLSDRERAIRFFGYFHPLLVHFPIALVFTAALSEFFLAFTGRRFFAPVSLFAIRFAAFCVILTALSGWAMASSGADMVGSGSDWVLEWHRWLGIGAASVTMLVAIISLWIDRESDRLFYRLMLYLAAASVAVAGHFGGMLIYGQNYFRW